MRADEAGLPVALGVVAHGRYGKVDTIFGEQRNAIGRRYVGEFDIDGQTSGDSLRDIDVVTLARGAFAGAEQGVVFAHTDTHLLVAEDAHQPVNARLAACARCGCCCAGLGKQSCKGGVGCGVLLRLRCYGGEQAREQTQSRKQHAQTHEAARKPQVRQNFLPRRFQQYAYRQKHAARSNEWCAPSPQPVRRASAAPVLRRVY